MDHLTPVVGIAGLFALIALAVTIWSAATSPPRVPIWIATLCLCVAVLALLFPK